MTEVVLDASALLAMLRNEPGGAQAHAALVGARVSAVNLAEVAQRLSDDGADDTVAAVLGELPCDIVDFDRDLAMRAGLMRRATKVRGLSLGHRACIALGRKLGARVFTADRAWADLDLGVEVVLIR